MTGVRDARQQALIEAVKAEALRVRSDTADQLAAAGADRDQSVVIVMQNVLRTCMEALIDEAIPFSEAVPVELALRLASYAISALPDERQPLAMVAVLRALPDAHRARMASGVRIKTSWGTVQ